MVRLTRTPARLMEQLAHAAAYLHNPGGDSSQRALERARQHGTEPPEWALPGRLIQRLKPEDRALLRDLGSNMIQDPAPHFLKSLID